MTEYRVLHFVRKSTQFKASFIFNQISNHIEYMPFTVFRKTIHKQYDGGFVESVVKSQAQLDLSSDETLYEKLLFKFVKILSKRQVLKIIKFITDNQIQICHFHFGTDCGIYTPLLQQLTIPSVVSFYGYDCTSFPNRFGGYGKLFLRSRVFNHATKILAMSDDMKADLLKIGCPNEKIIVHYHGSDVLRFYKPKLPAIQQEYVTILNLCSLVPKKGHFFLLRSIEMVVQRGVTNFRLKIIGTGILANELQSYARSHNLSSYVHFVGALPYGGPEMKKEYHTADIFIHPSVTAQNGDKEGIPGTIIEAMSAGIPVISTNHAGIPAIIKNQKTGILVDEQDYDALTKAIIELIKNPKTRDRIGKMGQQYALNNLNLNKKEIELEKLYHQTINPS